MDIYDFGVGATIASDLYQVLTSIGERSQLLGCAWMNFPVLLLHSEQ